MKDKNKRTARDIRNEIKSLWDWYSIANDKRVCALIQTIREENKNKIEALKKELAEMEAKKPLPKPRWSENTPADVLKECEAYWHGTEEFREFRIHCWSDKVICTGVPNGGYSTAGGWNPTPAMFDFISRKETEYDKAKVLKSLEGRQSAKALQMVLDELST